MQVSCIIFTAATKISLSAKSLEVLQDDLQGFEDDSVRNPPALRLFEQATALHRYLYDFFVKECFQINIIQLLHFHLDGGKLSTFNLELL